MADLSKYIAGWRQRAGHERERLAARQQQALSEALKIAWFLGEKFGVTKVLGVGSVLEPERFDQHPDIDLIVFGLPDSDYFSASAQIRFMTDFKVDLVPFESANALLRERAAAEGMQLWP